MAVFAGAQESKFKELNHSITMSEFELANKNWTTRVELDCNRSDQKNWYKQYQADRRRSEIKCAADPIEPSGGA